MNVETLDDFKMMHKVSNMKMDEHLDDFFELI